MAERFLWSVGAVEGCPPELCDLSLWGAEGSEQPFAASACPRSWAPCISEALGLSEPFKLVQDEEWCSMILLAPLQLRRLGFPRGGAGRTRQRKLSHPCRYWKLDPSKVCATGPNAWDTAVHDASEEYKHRMHNLCCDNCHSHVALALNLMRYDNSTSWNMVKLCFFTLLYGKYVSIGGFVKTWLPFVLLLGVIVTVVLTLHLR
ncbi:transmembrane protein 222 isoform X1 [Parus major]|uniref:transmembrane protein 222 isoform X1 n=1 Tax=Parus major TaxID=9157 RepID=UPI0007711535|nr:transmembrane protein 222 isoform X1 [Parus major]